MTEKNNRDDLYTSTDVESALIQGDSDTFERLIETADLSHRSENGSTLLHKAAIVGRDSFVTDLIERGIDLDAQDDEGKTALHRALELENYGVAERLITNGADLNTLDDHGRPPLSEAIRNVRSDKKFVRMLLEHGADPCQTNKNGESPLSTVRDMGYTVMAELLEEYVEEAE